LEHLNIVAQWPEDRLRRAVNDRKTPAIQRHAVQRMLAPMMEATELQARDTERGRREAVQFIVEHSVGKPLQRIEQRTDLQVSAHQCLAELEAVADPGSALDES
jgi:hypothetical protein